MRGWYIWGMWGRQWCTTRFCSGAIIFSGVHKWPTWESQINNLPFCGWLPIGLLYRKINSLEDTIIIQDDFVRLQQWENKWFMCFNPDECEVLRVNAKKKTLMADNNIQGIVLSVVPAAKYLVVSIDSRLSFNRHIDTSPKKQTASGLLYLGQPSYVYSRSGLKHICHLPL